MLQNQIRTYFLWIAASVANSAVVNPNRKKTLLANGFNTFFIKGNLVYSNGPKILPKNSWLSYFMQPVFENFILADEPFPKALRIFETCVLVNNNLCRKLFSSLESPTTFNERLKLLRFHFLLQILTY